MRTRFAAACCAAALLLTGCSTVVDGRGSQVGAASDTRDFPTPTDGPSGSPSPGDSGGTPAPSGSAPSGSSPTGADFSCPSVSFPSAYMTFNCVSDQLRVSTGSGNFPIRLSQTVEAATGWSLESAASVYTGTATSFSAVAADIRGDMISSGAYGDSPTYDIDDVSDSTISGHPAYTVADTVTLNPQWAKSRGTGVKVEKRWLVLVEYASGKFTAWYASIPDISQSFWSKVPSVIASIRVSV